MIFLPSLQSACAVLIALVGVSFIEVAHADEKEVVEAKSPSLTNNKSRLGNGKTDEDLPNIVVIFCDDLGYGDLGCFGHPTIKTPHLDQMAREGMKLTQFYSASSVCTPSRAALMTGRLPARSGMCSDRRRVLFPDSKGGIPETEITIAEALKTKGYATACIGKWHLGHLPQYLPTKNGFDYYFGIPYSNDMDRIKTSPKGRASFLQPKSEYFNVPLLEGTVSTAEKEIERPADQTTITKRYTEKAVGFIQDNKDKPFFLYLPHSLPHVPLFRSTAFEKKSTRGLYGDVIEEIDWSVGQVLQTLKETKLDKKTLVLFCSDNGPWLIFNEQGGSAGLLRDGKGATWEGGMREPTIAWMPGKVPAGTTNQSLGSTMDLFATCHSMAGIELPKGKTLDSFDLSPIIFENKKGTRDEVFYYRGYTLMAVRKGKWKIHLKTQAGYGPNARKVNEHDPPILYNLDVDPSEKYDVAKSHPKVIEELKIAIANHQKGMKPAMSQLENQNFKKE